MRVTPFFFGGIKVDEKVYKTINQRYNVLRSRDMDVSTNSHRRVLNSYNYYNLINGYKDPFLFSKDPEKYIIKRLLDGTEVKTTPNQLEALYKFDDALRKKLLEYLLQIEEELKNVFTQSFYEIHSINTDIQYSNRKNIHLDNEYLRRCYFDLSKHYEQSYENKNSVRGSKVYGARPSYFYFGDDKEPLYYNSGGYKSTQGKKYREVNKEYYYDSFKSKVYSTLAKQKSKSTSLERYSSKHGYVPMWILMNFLTFGNISKFYIFQTSDVKRDILKKLGFLNDSSTNSEFESVSLNFSRSLEILSIYRNTCAHNERVYCSSVSIPLDDNFLEFGKKLPFYSEAILPTEMNSLHKKTRKNARKKIFVVLFLISKFLNKRELGKFKNEIENQFDILENKLEVISIDDIKILMGLDFDWKSSL